MTDAGINAIPIENTKADKNPAIAFVPFNYSSVNLKGELVTLI